MSHIVTIPCKFTDLDTLVEAVQALGATLNMFERRATYYGTDHGTQRRDENKCEHTISVPGTHYTAAVTLDKEGNYCVGWDDYGSGHALTQVLGPGARKLKQAYAQATTIRYAKSKGWSYDVQTLPNGNQVVNLQTR